MPLRKTFCEEVPSVTVSTLAKRNLLDDNGIIYASHCNRPKAQMFVSGWGKHVTFTLMKANPPKTFDVEIERMPAPFGGSRPWFLCPTCNARRATLYLVSDLRCRKCLDLRYQVQYLPPPEKALKRISKIRHKLGVDPDPDVDLGPRMKCQHKATRARLLAELEVQEWRYAGAFLSPTTWG